MITKVYILIRFLENGVKMKNPIHVEKVLHLMAIVLVK